MKLQPPTPAKHNLCLQVARLEAVTETAARVHPGAAPLPAQAGAGAAQPACGGLGVPASAPPEGRQGGEDDLEETLPLLARRVLAGRQSVAPGQAQLGAAAPNCQASNVCLLAALKHRRHFACSYCYAGPAAAKRRQAVATSLPARPQALTICPTEVEPAAPRPVFVGLPSCCSIESVSPCCSPYRLGFGCCRGCCQQQAAL